MDVVSPDHSQTDHTAIWCYEENPLIFQQKETWSYPSKHLIKKGNRLYARGSSDMLGGVASILAAVSAQEYKEIKKNIAIILSDDEEKDYESVKNILDSARLLWKKNNQTPEGCIVCEPTGMKPIIGHRRFAVVNVKILGKSTHITRDDLGIDAFDYMHQIYSYIRKQYKKELQIVEHDNRFIPSSLTLNAFEHISNSKPKKNIHESSLSLYISSPSEYNLDDFLRKIKSFVSLIDKKLKNLNSQSSANFSVIMNYPGFIYDKESPFIKQFLSRFTENLKGCSFGTEVPAFTAHAIYTLVLGPGSMLQAHAPDEYVEMEQLEKATIFYSKYILENNFNILPKHILKGSLQQEQFNILKNDTQKERE